jgi:PAS domain S-box-containing protein
VVTHLLLIGVLGFLTLWAPPWMMLGGGAVPFALEGITVALGLAGGALALARYRWVGEPETLWLGGGLLGAAVLQVHHISAHAGSEVLAASPEPEVAGSWVTARSTLALMAIIAGLVAGRRASGRGSRVHEAAALLLAAGMIAAGVTGVPGLPAPADLSAIQGLGPVRELLPACLFLLGSGLWIFRGEWRGRALHQWIVLGLMTHAFVHLGLALHGAEAPQGPLPLVASALAVLGYGFFLVGLVAPWYRVGPLLAGHPGARDALALEEVVRAPGRPARTHDAGGIRPRPERLDDLDDLVLVLDGKDRLRYVNRAWSRTLDVGPSELEGRTLSALVHPRVRDALRRELERARREGEATGVQLVLQGSDGSTAALRGSLYRRDDGGDPPWLEGSFRDITQVTRLQRELERAQANLGALFESTGDAIWSVDTEYRLVTFNSAFELTVEALTGRAPKVGDEVDEVVAPWEVAWFRSCYERALAGNRFAANREERLDGELRTYELFFHPFTTPDGPAGVVVFSKDVTRRKQVEEALRRAKREAEEANRAKSHFMANMSHELRTPLNSVIGFANLLMKKDPEEPFDERGREFASRILANGRHLLGLINQLLDLAKIEAGRMELELGEVHLPELVSGVVRQLEAQTANRSLELRAEWEVEPKPVQTDEGKLRQVLINLVGNALKFTETGEVVITVHVDPETRQADRIDVRDTGIGIPADRLRAIFEAFRQADDGTARRYGGTGLGLTISRSLCALLGYRLSVESEEGVGSVFSIHLDGEPGAGSAPSRRVGRPDRRRPAPMPPEVQRWASAPEPPPDGLRGRRVLLVSDQQSERDDLTRYLTELGCRVLVAEDPSEALELARTHGPEIIVSNLVMEGLSGWELVEGLRSEPGTVPVPVIMLGLLDTDSGQEASPAALDILQKPVEREALVEAVERNRAGDPGRALVVEDDPDARTLFQRHLREEGWVAHAVENGEAALAFLKKDGVDLIVLDLMMPVMDGFTLLEELRRSEGATGVPVIVVTGMDLSSDERARLRRARRRGGRVGGEVQERLRRVLSRHLGEPSEGADR